MKQYSYKFIVYFVISLSACLTGFSQNPDIIRIKKDKGYVLFFQKGSRSDTLLKNRNNLFYMLVPDSLKANVLFSVENGQLIKTTNDSLVQLNYLPGLSYEYKYILKIEGQSTIFYKSNLPKNLRTKQGQYETLINGTSDFEEGKIRVQIRNTISSKLIDEFTFLIR